MITSILSWIWVSSGIILILLVLLHSPKGDGMGGLAASGSSMFTSASSAEATLNRTTWLVLAIFLSLAIILSAGWLNWPNISYKEFNYNHAKEIKYCRTSLPSKFLLLELNIEEKNSLSPLWEFPKESVLYFGSIRSAASLNAPEMLVRISGEDQTVKTTKPIKSNLITIRNRSRNLPSLVNQWRLSSW